jgi:anti-sigma B factor antagonist
MDIAVTQDGQVTIFEPPGARLDASNARDFRDTLHPLIDQYRRTVLDLSQLEFVDSSGLGALLSCLRRQVDAGGNLKLCGLQRPVRALFELVRMHRVFEIHNTRQEAVNAFQAASR